MEIKDYIYKWKSDFDFKTFINSLGSMLVSGVFGLYNGFLGIRHASPWHSSIFIYYLLLTVIRFILINSERKAGKGEKAVDSGHVRLHLFSSVLLLVQTVSLILPIRMMTVFDKPVKIGLIPSIAMAAYTTYKISMASVNFRRKNASENRSVKILRSINFMDALLSVITLQNTLIMVNNEGSPQSMLPLTAATSGLIWIGMMTVAVHLLIRCIRKP